MHSSGHLSYSAKKREGKENPAHFLFRQNKQRTSPPSAGARAVNKTTEKQGMKQAACVAVVSGLLLLGAAQGRQGTVCSAEIMSWGDSTHSHVHCFACLPPLSLSTSSNTRDSWAFTATEDLFVCTPFPNHCC
jgi:hypothetical protein